MLQWQNIAILYIKNTQRTQKNVRILISKSNFKPVFIDGINFSFFQHSFCNEIFLWSEYRNFYSQNLYRRSKSRNWFVFIVCFCCNLFCNICGGASSAFPVPWIILLCTEYNVKKYICLVSATWMLPVNNEKNISIYKASTKWIMLRPAFVHACNFSPNAQT